MPKFEIVSPVKLKTQSIRLVSIVTAAGHFVRIHNYLISVASMTLRQLFSSFGVSFVFLLLTVRLFLTISLRQL